MCYVGCRMHDADFKLQYAAESTFRIAGCSLWGACYWMQMQVAGCREGSSTGSGGTPIRAPPGAASCIPGLAQPCSCRVESSPKVPTCSARRVGQLWFSPWKTLVPYFDVNLAILALKFAKFSPAAPKNPGSLRSPGN